MRVRSFDQATLPLRVLVYATGLRMFQDGQGRLRPVLSFLYLGFLLLLYFAAMFTYRTFQPFDRTMKLERALFLFMMVMNCITVAVSTLFGVVYTKLYVSLERKIVRVDTSLARLGIPLGYGAMFAYLLLALGVCVTNAVASFVIHTRWTASVLQLPWAIVVYLVGSHCYGGFVGVLVIFQFVVCVAWLRMRHKQINEFLGQGFEGIRKGSTVHPESLIRKNAWTTKSGASVFGEPRKKLQLLRTFRQVHLDLCIASKTTHRVFGVQVSMQLGLALLYIFGTFYYNYIGQTRKTIPYPTVKGIDPIVVIGAVQCFLYIIEIGIVSAICEYNMREANRISEVIHAFRDRSSDPETKEELQQFSLQIGQSQLALSMIGFNQLNYGFIRQCINSVTTYLVIMIQMSISLETKRKKLKANLQLGH